MKPRFSGRNSGAAPRCHLPIQPVVYPAARKYSGNNFSVVYNCSGTALTNASVYIAFNDTANLSINTSNLVNRYPNQAPTTGTPTLTPATIYKTTANVTCNNGSTSDADSDAVSVYYNGFVNGTAAGREPQGIGTAATRTMIGAVAAILVADLAVILLTGR